MNKAGELVDIAKGLFDFGRTADGDLFARSRENPAIVRPLKGIRSDLSMLYEAKTGDAPSRSTIADALTALEGKAQAAEPDSTPETAAVLSAAVAASQSIATALVEMATRHYEIGITPDGDPYGVPVSGPRIAFLLRGGHHSLRAELARRYYAKRKSAAPSSALADAMLALEGLAQEAEPVPLALRVAQLDDGALVLDLGDDTGRAVVIRPGSWTVEETPVVFRRTRATKPLPEPERGGALTLLWSLVNVRSADIPLLAAWLVAALFPEIPHPVLFATGEQGSAKTTFTRLMTRAIDPSPAQTSSAPGNVNDWSVACAASWTTTLDNMTHIQPWLSDAMCKAVTGDGLKRRALYTDSDVSILAFRRVLAITAIGLPSLKGDLASRMLSIVCRLIPESARRSDEDITREWESAHALILGAVCDLAAEVLKVLPDIELDSMPRMADYARILAAVDKVAGRDIADVKSGYQRYLLQSRDTSMQVAESDQVAIAVRENITEECEHTAGELIYLLIATEHPPRGWPSSPQAMGVSLDRIAPDLRALGWTVERRPKDRKGNRKWRIAPPGKDGK